MPLFLLSGRNAFAGPGDFQLAIRDIVLTEPNILEFDVYLLDMDPLNEFCLNTEQFGILFNSEIYEGGAIPSISIDNAESGLIPGQLITASPVLETNNAYPGQTLIKLVGVLSEASFDKCTLISTTSPGTLITHFVLTSTVNFASGTTPDLSFTASTAETILYATSISVSDGTEISDLAVTPPYNAIVESNPVLNVAPAQPGAISGSAVQCSGVTGQTYSVEEVADATSYNWTLPTGWVVTDGNNTNSITVTIGSSGGAISVTASNDDGTSPATTLDVTVNPTPLISNQTESVTSGITFNLTPAGAPEGTTYTWPAPVMDGGMTGGVAQTTGVESINGTLTIPSGSGNAVYTVTPTTGSCVGNTFTVTVTVTSDCDPVEITSDPVITSMCAGGTASFSVTATGTEPSFQWQYNNGGTWGPVANGTPAGATYTGANADALNISGITAAGDYDYQCYITNCDGGSNVTSSPATLTVNANPPRPLIEADGPATFCQGEDVVLTSSATVGNLWSTGEETQSITVKTQGNYWVTVTDANGCQNTSAITEVKVNPLPSTPTITPSGSVSICAGSSQVLTSSISPGGSYVWSNEATTQSISVDAEGSYTVQVTNTYGCYSPASLPTTVTVSPPPATPTITPSGTVAVCAGESITLTSSLSTSYLWSTGATTRSISVSTAGNYSVRVTDANGCQSLPSASTTVTVNPLPSPPTIGTITQPSCAVQTGSVVLGGLPAGSWTVNPGNIAGTTSTVTVAALTAGSHTFTVTNSSGCTSGESAAVVINTPPAVPTAPVVGTVTQPTCAVATGSVGFSGLPSTGMWTLTRIPGGLTTTGIGTTNTLTGVPSGTWTFTVTNIDGCISPATAPVTISDPLPIPPAPVVSVDCSSGAGNAVVTVTTPTGTGYQYRLDTGPFQPGNIFTSVNNGDHTVTVRNASGCTTTGPLFTVNCDCANPATVTLSATSGSTCGTAAVTVSGNTFGGGATRVTITENGGGTVTPSSSTTSPFTFTYTPVSGDAGRIVIVTVTTDDPAGDVCTAASATYTLTVNAIPAAPVPGTVTHPTCAAPAGSVILNNLPSPGEWTITVTPGGRTVTGTGSSTTVTGLAPGSYTFTVTSAAGCTSASSSAVVINAQPDTPSAPIIGTITQPTCGTSTGSVALSGLPATGSWTVTRSPGNLSVSGSGTARTITGMNPGTYTFTVTNASGCISPPSEEAVIDPQPVTPAPPVIGAIVHPTCDLATGNILLQNMPETGEWTLFRYPGGISSTGTGSSTTISSLAPGTYNFAVRNDEGCTSLVSGNAVINAQPPTPTPPVVGTITHPTFAVPTGSVVLSGMPSSGTWTLTRYPDGITIQGTGTTRTVSELEPGTYTFTVTNFYNCTSHPTGNVVINARPGAPNVVINNPPNICENQTTDFTIPAVTAGSDPNLTFTYWTDPEATAAYATPEAAPAGTYYIMGTSTAGYFTIKEVVVTADVIPTANAGPDQVLDYIFGTSLNADIPEIGIGMWELVSGAGEIFNSTAPSTQVNGLALGENVFSWSVTNGACDPVTDYIVVTVNNLIIPTLITPNQDGHNDFFVLRGLEETLGRTELAIFDRRGLKVYENSDYDNSWEGLDYNSNPLPEDTYFYVVRAANGISRSGYIVVRR